MQHDTRRQASLTLSGAVNDLLAGTIVAASNVALAAGFAAVIFQGDLKAGFATGMWSILVSMIIIGVLLGILTTLRPIVAGGPDTAVVAVMSILAASISTSMLNTGAQIDSVVTHVLMSCTLVAAVYGFLLWFLGTMGWAKALRFVPFPLIGGFLAATGALLLKGSPELVLGTHLSFDTLTQISTSEGANQIRFMLLYFLCVVLAHHKIRSPFIMPLSFFVAVVLSHLAIMLGVIDGSDWFVSASNGLKPWTPIAALASREIDWTVIVAAIPEIIACVLVGIFSLVIRVSTIEAMRRESADIDRELRSYGIANLIAMPTGAMPGGILFSSSKLIQVAGYKTPLCYCVTAGLLFIVVAFGADLSPLLPKPVLGGLLMYLGYTMSLEAARIVIGQSTLNVLLAVVIFVLCLQFGFVAGAIFGILCACLIFAIDCSRTGVVRYHFTRAEISGGTEWPATTEEHIRKFGKSIHIYELSGFIFFGSSEQLFQDIRGNVLTQFDPPISFVILDLSKVSGYDGAALNTMVKLQGFADKLHFKIVFCGINSATAKSLKKVSLISGNDALVYFTSRLEAVYWCECQLLDSLPAKLASEDYIDFRHWISDELGLEIEADMVLEYFLRREFEAGEEVYRQGADADTIDFIYSGSVIMKLKDGSRFHAIRRATRRTVIGEMGFFRNEQRSVSVFASEPLVMYSITHEKLAELQRCYPHVHCQIQGLIIRVLADRVDMANREISVLR